MSHNFPKERVNSRELHYQLEHQYFGRDAEGRIVAENFPEDSFDATVVNGLQVHITLESLALKILDGLTLKAINQFLDLIDQYYQYEVCNLNCVEDLDSRLKLTKWWAFPALDVTKYGSLKSGLTVTLLCTCADLKELSNIILDKLSC